MRQANMVPWRFPLFIGTAFFLFGVGNARAQQADWSMKSEKLVRVEIQLKGTTIDEIPDVVYVVSDAPERAAGRLLSMGGGHDPIHNLVHMPRLDYWFVTPKEVKQHVGVELPQNSVVYEFSSIARTADVRNEFAKRFDLKDPIKVSTHYANSRTQYLYSADRGFYVRLDDLPGGFTCTLHPGIRKPKPGSCPTCGLDLVPVK